MTSTRTKFGRDVIISGVATVLKSLRNLLIVRVITFNLSMADYGLWEQISVGIAFVIPWITLQLPGALVRFLAGEQDREELREGYYSIFFSVLVLGCLLSLCLWIALPFLDSYAALAPFLIHADIILLLIPLTAVLNVTFAYLRAFMLMIRHALLSLSQHFGELAALAYALQAGGGLGGALLAVALIRTIILLVGMGIALGRIGFKWPRFSLLRAYLSYSLPTVPTSSLYRLFDAGDRFVLAYFLGNAAVGLYSVAYMAGSFFTIILSPVHFVLLPLMAELWHARRFEELSEYLTQTIRYSAMLILPILAGTVLLARPIFFLLVPATYEDGIPYFPVIGSGFACFSLGVLGSNFLATAGKTQLILLLVGSLAGLNLLLNLVLVPLIGIPGAVIATVLSQAFFTSATLIRSHAILPFHLPWPDLLRCIGSSVAMSCVLLLTRALYPGLPLFIAIAEGGLIYFVLLWFLRVISHREFEFLGRLLSRR